MTLTEKRQKRGQLIEEMKALQKTADNEKRSMTAEESAKWDAIDGEQEKLRSEIEAEEKETSRRSRLQSLEQDMGRSTGATTRPQPGDGASTQPTETRSLVATPGYASLADLYLRNEIGLAEVRSRIQTELRADTLQAGLFVKAGALVMPQQMASGLIAAVDDETFMMQLVNVERLTQAESLGIGTLDADPDDADWTSELKTGSQTDLSVGKRELRPHPMAKRVKVSNTLLRRTAGGAAALVNRRVAYKVGITAEKAFLTGDGVRKPLGVFVASNDGIPTSRDISTGNTKTEITADGLIEAKYGLKAAYWRNASWIFPRTAVKQVRKLKDGNGQYLWAPGLTGGQPDRILDSPFRVSEYAPSTFAASQYVGILGDFKAGYTAVIALDMTVQILDQLYAETNQTGYLARMEMDGAPVLSEAFVRVQLAA